MHIMDNDHGGAPFLYKGKYMKRTKADRIHNDEKIIAKRKKDLKDSGNLEYLKTFKGKEHKLTIKHPLDCGVTKCPICSSHKKNKACKNKFKDEHGLVEDIILKEVVEEVVEELNNARIS